jgi:thiol-disulfide isomerase/thioredoxin
MPNEQGPVHAPDFPKDATWLQGGPLSLADLRGRPVLIDFWDYTCLNCLRTLPYVKEWHQRYREHGLTVVGVHAPEFSFAHHPNNVRRAIEQQGITYPVVLDNEYAIWQAYANRYWPAKYLVDREGYLRYYHFGEGAYHETEAAVQALLREAFPEILLPGLMEPMREEDAPGAVCYRVTPELYLGYERGRIGNMAGIALDSPAAYRDVDKHAEGYFYLEGDWLLTAETSARPVGAKGPSKLHLRYMAKEVNVVMHPPLVDRQGRLELLQDGAPLAAEDAGADVSVEDAVAVVRVNEPRMYRLVNNRAIDTHDLTLVTQSDGLSLFALRSSAVSCRTPKLAPPYPPC